MTRRQNTTTAEHRGLSAFPLLVMSVACLTWGSSATAEDCDSPCTVSRAGLPTFRLVNTVGGIPDWDLETSAFGVELARLSDSPNTGAFRVDHFAQSNTLVIGRFPGNVGIRTSVPEASLHIGSSFPSLRLDDTSFEGGRVDIVMSSNSLTIRGNDLQVGPPIAVIDTRSPLALRIDEMGNVGVGLFLPQAKLHVAGDARVEGNFSVGSRRTLKTAFSPVSSSEILARVTDLPVASWRYQSEGESTRHIGPFAEDFQRLFGIGDGETISVVDAQGVSFAAIQGLAQRLAEKEAEAERQLAEKDAQIAELAERLTRAIAAQNAELTARLAAIEKRMSLRERSSVERTAPAAAADPLAQPKVQGN
jgi:hypothetical protein